MNEIVMTEWALTNANASSPYQAPELIGVHLHGKVFGHPNHENGKIIETTRIAEVINDNVCKTGSGNTYRLEGPPSEGYINFCKQNSIEIDFSKPFGKVRKSHGHKN